ncbi:glycosyltransferase [Actinomycetospora sp. CA-101289]|uniref:glycosyltransferase n=1 Tax=Actinomycetospora sp. CA-101289 TaxID=3239893 RepID=UPI003D967C0E
MSDPILSLVTITRDDPAGLAATLESVTKQTCLSSTVGLWDYHIVDGLSSDLKAIEREVSKAAGLGVDVHLRSEADSGVYDAMNRGICRSRGRYLWFLNSGDMLHSPNSLGTVLNALESGSPWFVFGAMHLFGLQRPPQRISNVPHNWFRHALGIQPHCHQATVFSRALLAQLGNHDLRYGVVADFDTIMRAGVMARPEESEEVIVDYAGGGLSFDRALDLPHMLADVRDDRFELQGIVRAANHAFARYRSTRVRLHLTRRRLRSISNSSSTINMKSDV